MRAADRLRLLEPLVSLAPRGVAAAVEAILRRPRLTLPARRDAERLMQRAGAAAPPDDGACCAFPVVATSADAPIAGGVLHALASWDRRMGACGYEDAFPGEARLHDQLGRISGAYLQVLPAPAGALVELEGGSAGAAFALAVEASRRGLAVPRDVVVSGGLDVDANGHLLLRPVGGCDRKREVLERERPGCRFFFVPAPGEEVRPSQAIELHAIEPGPATALFDRVLAVPGAMQLDALHRDFGAAEKLFADQRYAEAAIPYRRIADELATGADLPDAPRWRLVALSRLGAIELHGGDPAGAEVFFAAARDWAASWPALSGIAVDELQLHIAGGLIDRFDPEAAAAVAAPLLARWEARLRDDPDGESRRMILIAALGAMRRVHLLRGEVEEAIAVQRRLAEWSPGAERARSLGDLADCLRRGGLFDEATAALAAARDALRWIPLETYRLQTTAFLAWTEGRLALDAGRPAGPLPLGIREGLPPRSAAGWRLELLQNLLALRDGDATAADALVRQADGCTTDFRRWQACLGLLRGAQLAPAHQPALHAAAARHFRKMPDVARRHSRLQDAREALLHAVESGTPPDGAAQLLLLHAAY